MKFSGLKITQKLAIISVVVLVMMCSVAGVFEYLIYINESTYKQGRHSEAVKGLIHQVVENVLRAGVYQQRFFMNSSTDGYQQYRAAISKAHRQLSEVEAINRDDVFKKDIDNLRELVTIYEKEVNELIELKRTYGIDHKINFIGLLGKAAPITDKIMEMAGVSELLMNWVRIRRMELRFFGSHDPALFEEYRAEYDLLQADIAQWEFEPEREKDLQLLLQDYDSHFMSLSSVMPSFWEAQERLNQLYPQMGELVSVIQGHLDKQDLEVASRWDKAWSMSSWLHYLLLLSIALVLFPLMYYIMSGIHRSTYKTTDMLKEIANGEAVLTNRLQVEGNDEMAELAGWFNMFMDKLQHVLGEIESLSIHLFDVSLKAQTTRDKTTQAIQNQVGDVYTISSAITSMSDKIAQVATVAREASDKAHDAREKSEGGARVIDDVIHAINDLSVEVEQAGQSVTELDAQSKTIHSVITLIKDIAEQTNLLALNAAIEAARAGDAGRGFAVVADEVRNLSMRTTESTEEIRKIIDVQQRNISHVVTGIEKSRQQAVNGVRLTEQAGDAINSINSSVGQIDLLNEKVSDSAGEHSVMAGEITKNIRSIENAIQSIADTARQSMSDTGDLSQTATLLKTIASRFGKSGLEGNPPVEEASKVQEVELF